MILLLLSITILLLIMASTAIVNGYVLSVLWGWFVVPALGLPPLTIPSAIGLAMVIGYLTHQYSPKDKIEPEDEEERKKQKKKELIDAISHIISRPISCLIVGWIVHLFM